MTLTLDQTIGQKLLLSFNGPEPSPEILGTIQNKHIGGVTLFRSLDNTDTPAQVRALTEALQAAAAASGQPPLLIGADQEGGQLVTIGNGPTPFSGNLALGAAGSVELARQVGLAMGQELAAMGVNIDYAPVCDVNSNPKNPAIGTRSFGEDPAKVGQLAAAMIEGLQAAGIAATAKHFPGHGDTATDSHYGIPQLLHDKKRLDQVELPPFKAAIKAGVRLMMMGHLGLPKLHNGQSTIPATLSPQIVRTLLQDELGFTGVTITDAMDMGAIEQGIGLTIDAIAAAAAGIDLLILNVETDRQNNVYAGLLQAAQRGLLVQADMITSAQRILDLKAALAEISQPSLDVVGCAQHLTLAREVAHKSITLVRDDANLLPLRLSPEARVAVVIPQPADLTPADTSSYVTCSLAEIIRRRQPNVTEFNVAHHPPETEIAAVCRQASAYDLVIVGTLNAYAQTEQGALVNALLSTGVPLIAVAMRTPYDLQSYPDISTYLCSYSILEPSMEALVQILWGDRPAVGRLPVSIPDLYPIGHRFERVVTRADRTNL